MDMGNIELIRISINIGGTDYLLDVDQDTAQQLLNDQTMAEHYVQEAYNLNLTGEEEIFTDKVQKENPTEVEPSVEPLENRASTSTSDSIAKRVWFSKGKPTLLDEEATIYFLKLREKYARKYASKFDDKKTVKNKLWPIIGNEMEAAGYSIGNSKESSALKCKQKFLNLEAKYLKHKEHMNKTGSSYVEPPKYFDILHSILSHKHKINPACLVDTAGPFTSQNENISQQNMCDSETSNINEDIIDSNATNSPHISTDSIKNRFKVTERSKSSPRKDVILTELKRQFEIEQNSNKEFLNVYTESQNTQNQQRQELNNLFSEFLSRKRKRDEQ